MKFRKRIALFLVNKIIVSKRSKALIKRANVLRWGGFKIGKQTKIVGPIYISANLEIGDNCWIGKNFIANGNGFVIIGDNVDIGPEVVFNTGGHEIGNHFHRAGEGKSFTQRIGNGSWIGANAVFLNNVNIGDGCVVAGGAVVVDSCGDDLLIGGVPAKTIKKLN